MKLIEHPVFPSMVTIGHRALAATAPVPHDPTTPAPTGNEAGTPDETAIQTALVIIAKGTFEVDDVTASPSLDQVAILDADETLPPLGEPLPPLGERLMLTESDLAIFKPRSDVIVAGAPQPPEPPEPGATLVGADWEETVTIGAESMRGTFSAPDPPTEEAPMTFGWQSRILGPRVEHAGRFGGPALFDEFVNSGHRLPVGFTNRFFNGARYQGDEPAFSHPAPRGEVIVSTSGSFDLPGGGTGLVTGSVTLHLPSAFPTATVRYRDAIGRARHEELSMNADTIVYDKGAATFTVTWRANFDFLSVPGDRYGEILVSGAA